MSDLDAILARIERGYGTAGGVAAIRARLAELERELAAERGKRCETCAKSRAERHGVLRCQHRGVLVQYGMSCGRHWQPRPESAL